MCKYENTDKQYNKSSINKQSTMFDKNLTKSHIHMK